MTTPTTDEAILAAAGGEPEQILPFNVTRKSDDVLVVSMDNVYPGWEQWFLLLADVHWDNPHCRRDLLYKLLDLALERNAGTFIFGDLLCLMQGRNDKRGSKSSVREEHKVDDYFGAVVTTASEAFRKYRRILKLLARGNHETAVLKQVEIDLIKLLADKLDVPFGGYAGFIRFRFSRGNSNRHSYDLFYHHGHGGGGEVTKGVMQAPRRAVWLPDAKFVVTGHIHEVWSMPIPRLRISQSDIVYKEDQEHIQLGTFKDEFDLQGGYHIEKGRPPKPLGGAWLHFYYDRDARGNVGYQILRAK